MKRGRVSDQWSRIHRARVASGEFQMAFGCNLSRSGYLARSIAAQDRPIRDCNAFGEVAAPVENVGDTAAHSGGEISSGRGRATHRALGHEPAAAIADAFDDGGSGVADCEALAGHAVEEGFHW